MKTINALLLLVLIFAVNSALSGFKEQKCDDYVPSAWGGGDLQAYSLDFCRSTAYGSYYRCCFLKYEDASEKRQYHCAGVSSAEFWDIDSTIDNIEKLLGVEIDSLDCSASYLYVSLLLIFALLF